MKKKSKTPIIAIALCAVVLAFAALSVLILTGKIGGEKRDPDKQRFETFLREKYGEEFVCLEASKPSNADNVMIISGICAPARDMSLTFEAEIDVKLDETQNIDYYPTAIANRQLTEEFTERLGDDWGEFTASCEVAKYYHDNEIVEKVRSGTFDWQDLAALNNKSRVLCVFTVLVNGSTNISDEDEWNALQEIAAEYRSELEKLGADLGLMFDLYFAPDGLYEECAAKINAPPPLDFEFIEEKLDGRDIRILVNMKFPDESAFTHNVGAYVKAKEEINEQ